MKIKPSCLTRAIISVNLLTRLVRNKRERYLLILGMNEETSLHNIPELKKIVMENDKQLYANNLTT